MTKELLLDFSNQVLLQDYLQVLVTIPWLNLKTVCIDSLLGYILFCFLYSSVFFS